MRWCWTVVANFRLGEWDTALAAHERMLTVLGERPDPPRPWLQSFAITALIADARGDRSRSNADLEVVLRGAEAQRYRTVTGATWASLLFARRGRSGRRRADGSTR